MAENTYFGNVKVVGNTILKQNLVVQGAYAYFVSNLGTSVNQIGIIGQGTAISSAYFTGSNATTVNVTSIPGSIGVNTTSGIGANVTVIGNIVATNAVSISNMFSSKANITTLNTTSIGGFFGVNTTLSSGTTLYIAGNGYATNALTTSNIFTTNVNVSGVTNTLTLITQSDLGVGGVATGADLYVNGNAFLVNAIVTSNIFTTNVNVTRVTNTMTLIATSNLGIGITPTGANLYVQGNIFTTNSVTMTNLVATGTLSYTENLVKRSPYLRPDSTNVSDIQEWINATCNAADQPVSWWTMNGPPTYSNIVSGPSGVNSFFGSVLLPDGRVLFVPYSEGVIGIFNPFTNQYSTITPNGDSVAGSGRYASGVLTPSGNVVFCPQTSGNVGVFNPVSSTFSNATPKGGSLYTFGVLDGTGNVVFGTSSNVVTYSPTRNVLSNIIASGGAIVSMTLLPNGNVFYNSSGLISNYYNPYTVTRTALTALPTGSSAARGAVLTPSGKIVIIPFANSNIVVVTPSTTSIITSNIVVASSTDTTQKFAGGVLLPSGNIVCVPYSSLNVGLVDPEALTYSNLICGYYGGTTQFSGGILLPDGRVVFTPYNSANVGVLSTCTPAPVEFCLSPYFNKF